MIPAVPAPPAIRELPLEFRGTAHEYFGIWLINLILNICTLGIYSAWAFVRTRRYFLGTTRIDGHAFDYHATGGQIFVGRLIALLILAAFYGLSFIGLWALIAANVGFLFLAPWAINRSLAFHARMTSWRNIHFDFQGGYGRALWVFIIMPILCLIPAGLLLPVAARAAAIYVADGYRLGTARFSARPRLLPFYGGFFASVGLLVIFAALPVWYLLGNRLFWTATARGETQVLELMLIWYFYVILVFAAIGAALGGVFYAAWTRNAIARGLMLEGGHRFDSTMKASCLLWITMTNALAIAFSFGLLRPWATVRRIAYERATITVLAAGDLDEFTDTQREAGRATGAGLADLGGIAISP